MAIFDKIQITIMIDGAVVPEYDCSGDQDDIVEDDDAVAGSVIKKYIESHIDQNFAIRLHLQGGFEFVDCDGLECQLYIDGVCVVNPLLLAASLKNGTVTQTRIGVGESVDGSWQLRKFRFSKLIAGEFVLDAPKHFLKATRRYVERGSPSEFQQAPGPGRYRGPNLPYKRIREA